MATRALIADDHGVVRQGLKMSPERAEELTERETEVLKLLARGRTNKHIASALFVEEKTVKTYDSSMLRKNSVCIAARRRRFTRCERVL